MVTKNSNIKKHINLKTSLKKVSIQMNNRLFFLLVKNINIILFSPVMCFRNYCKIFNKKMRKAKVIRNSEPHMKFT